MAIADTLKEAVNTALQKGWTLRGLADASGVNHPTLSRWLSGQRTITLESAESLCRFFSCDLGKPRIPKPPKGKT